MRRTGGQLAAIAALLAWHSAAGASEPADVSSESELAERLDVFSRRAPPTDLDARPTWLQGSADRYGAFVARAREIAVGADWFERAVAVGAELAATGQDTRSALEDRTGDREAELEALYSSQAWQRLDYARVMLDYWRAWAGLSLALQSPDAAVRNQSLHHAKLGFTHSALEHRLPRVAAASLLGLGIARRELGELTEAKRSLLQLERQLARVPDETLTGPLQAELAGIAFALGDIEVGAHHAAQIPADSVLPERLSELALDELEARLAVPDPDAGSRDTAAASIRDLIARGGEPAQRAASLAARHFGLLEERDIGPLGGLLRAESAFDAGDFERARDLYRLTLDTPHAIPGMVPDTARFKWARSLSECGDLQKAARELERLLSDGGGGSVRGAAAQLWFALAERLLREAPGDAASQNALRAARQLLDVAPDAPSAESARLRIARSAKRERERIEALEAISESSTEFRSARLELARLRAGAFMRTGGKASTARQLALDIDTLAEWVVVGRLAAEPARDTAFAVVRAKASLRAGDSANEVLQWVARAEARPALNASQRRVLLRVRLQAQVRARRYQAFDTRFNQTQDAEFAPDWLIWREAASLAVSAAPRPLVASWYARLERLAPEGQRRAARFDHTRALLTSGRNEDALARARDHVAAEPFSGDARVLLARALDAAGSPIDAHRAWLDVAAGVEPGTERWLRAQLAASAALRRAGRDAEACRSVEAIVVLSADVDAGSRAAIDAAREPCRD